MKRSAKSCFLALAITTLVLQSFSFCLSQKKIGITKERAIESAKIEIKRLGSNPDYIEYGVEPRRVTLAWWEGLHSPIPWIKESKKWLGEKLFWKVNCHVKGAVGGTCYVFVDANNGEVLYFYDIDANIAHQWVREKKK